MVSAQNCESGGLGLGAAYLSKLNAGGSPVMYRYSMQEGGVEIHLVTSCYRKQGQVLV